ncbi:MAG: WYL domain-containing protein [Lachnospiraceae bacterium]|nr:WYL domain-containing protein [Lachnospiraceae bacterium]
MARGSNQKLKILYLMKIFLEKSDESHPLTMEDILTELKRYGVTAERKSIYADIEALRSYGMDIVGEKQGKAYHYYTGSRQFELAELKLLVDSVQSAKFITTKKSNELIRKLESLSSIYEAKQLQRQVYVTGRIKADNESIYYNVDKIHTAIATDAQITFQYFQWNVEKERELRREGEKYCVSPWALSWDDENYYLIGFDSEAEKIKHYRVDKMLKIDIIQERREGKEKFEQFDMAAYARKMFGMFSGEEENVRIEFDNELAGVVIDRFGRDTIFTKTDKNHFEAVVKVAVSRQFLGWIMALGEGVRILAPESVVWQMQEEAKRLARTYSLPDK